MTIKEIQALQEPVTDPLEQQFREWIGDVPPFMRLRINRHRDIYAGLPLLKDISIPKYQENSNIFGIILFDAGEKSHKPWKLGRSRHWFFAKTAIWAMQSILKNSDALEYQNQIDFAFLVEEHCYPEIQDVFQTAGVPEQNIILATVDEHDAYIQEENLHSCAKLIMLPFSQRMHRYEQVITQTADIITAKPKYAPKVPLFSHLIGNLAGDMNKPKYLGGISDHLPAQLLEWATPDTIKRRMTSHSRSLFIEKFSEATGIPLKQAKEMCDFHTTDIKWCGGTAALTRWPVKHYVEKHPKRVEWIYKWMKDPIIGPDNELGMFSVFPWYLQEQEGVELADSFETLYIPNLTLVYSALQILEHIKTSKDHAWFSD